MSPRSWTILSLMSSTRAQWTVRDRLRERLRMREDRAPVMSLSLLVCLKIGALQVRYSYKDNMIVVQAQEESIMGELIILLKPA